MNKLQDIINWLYESKTHVLEIYNLKTGARLEKQLSSDELSQYDSYEDYFAKLLSQGVTDIQVQKAVIRGRSNVRKGLAKNFNLSANGEVAENGSSQPKAAIPVAQPNNGLNGGFSQGLTGDAAYKYFDHERLKAENAELKTDNKRLETENRTLENDNRDLKNKLDQKPSEAVDIIKNITAPESIAQIFAGVEAIRAKKAGETQALNAPELSRHKRQLVDKVSSQHFPDQSAMSLDYIITLSTESKEFAKELTELLNKHQQNASNS